jgi:serine/threonine-protein kinase
MMRFEREATAAARIKSPHVVKIFEHGMAEERIPTSRCALLDGESLGRRFDRCDALGVSETAAIVSQVCPRAFQNARERRRASRHQARQHLFSPARTASSS